MRILVLGGYGLIGAEVMRACASAGFPCVGLGRNAATGRRLAPDADWIGADMATLTTPEAWAPHLNAIDAIVNVAGALQDGARDNLEAIHHRAIVALVTAAERAGVPRFVQISAPGAVENASTAFLRTKARGDAALRASQLDWVILKPGLVIAPGAYGGTALLRMAAGFPFVQPLAASKARIQTVSIADVANAVVAALSGRVPMRKDYDLVEDAPHSLREIARALRQRLGFAPAKVEFDLPRLVAPAMGVVADIAGLLGWRSPLRSTALKVLEEDVLGDPAPWRAVTGASLAPLSVSLAQIPSSAQERVFARAALAMPLMIATLAGFWTASGAIALLDVARAAAVLPGNAAAPAMVVAGALADLAVGAGLLFRRTARGTAIASILLALFYLAMGTLLAPQLWSDPLGPYVKVFPAIVLAAAIALMLEER